jgi:hypothetical protein
MYRNILKKKINRIHSLSNIYISIKTPLFSLTTNTQVQYSSTITENEKKTGAYTKQIIHFYFIIKPCIFCDCESSVTQ